MLSNLIGKFRYISHIMRDYPKWYLIFWGRLTKKPIIKLKIKNNLIIVGGKRSQILDISDEIFVHKVYNPKYMALVPNATVVDIGANVGIFSLYATMKHAEKIYAIEPLLENIHKIEENFKLNKMAKPEIIRCAVAKRSGVNRLYLADFDSHGLLFNHNHKKTYTKYTRVPVDTLTGLIQKRGINHIDFLKIDCEGSEGEIVCSTPPYIWSKIDKVAVEYHNEVSKYNGLDINNRLKKMGYQTRVKSIDPYLGYIYAWRKNKTSITHPHHP
jgi:FkbM family methyltransferase